MGVVVRAVPAEFPFFQKQSARLAKKVAFLGVDSKDNDDDARKFLEEYPVPYPSYKDPSLEVAAGASRARSRSRRPRSTTRRASSAYVEAGRVREEADLVADIERYAR